MILTVADVLSLGLVCGRSVSSAERGDTSSASSTSSILSGPKRIRCGARRVSVSDNVTDAVIVAYLGTVGLPVGAEKVHIMKNGLSVSLPSGDDLHGPPTFRKGPPRRPNFEANHYRSRR